MWLLPAPFKKPKPSPVPPHKKRGLKDYIDNLLGGRKKEGEEIEKPPAPIISKESKKYNNLLIERGPSVSEGLLESILNYFSQRKKPSAAKAPEERKKVYPTRELLLERTGGEAAFDLVSYLSKILRPTRAESRPAIRELILERGATSPRKVAAEAKERVSRPRELLLERGFGARVRKEPAVAARPKELILEREYTAPRVSEAVRRPRELILERGYTAGRVYEKPATKAERSKKKYGYRYGNLAEFNRLLTMRPEML